MKKLLMAVVAMIVLCACNSERGYLDYRGLSMGMSAKAMCDSFIERGFLIDSVTTDSGSTYALYSNTEKYRISIYYENDTINDVVESYAATYNDSTSNLWQQLRDKMANDIHMPYMTHRADLHKEAVFKTDEGTITLILLNTYTPTLSIRYSNHIIDY
jgi:hypothetical protein